MSKLKPCPFCGKELKTDMSRGITYFLCFGCGAVISFRGAEARNAAIRTVNRRTQPANEPLTLEQLREHYTTCHDCIDAEPSRTVTCGYVCRSKSSPCRGRVTVGYDFCSYGHRKPEGSENDAKV